MVNRKLKTLSWRNKWLQGLAWFFAGAVGVGGVSSVFATPSTSRLIQDTREQIEFLEQLVLSGMPEDQIQFAERVRKKIIQTSSVLTPLLTKHGIEVSDSPNTPSAQEKNKINAWVNRLKQMSSTDFCEVAELAYVAAIVQLDTLSPTKKIESVWDILFDPSKGIPTDVSIDRIRAEWASRYINAIPLQDYPKGCLEIGIEAKKRRDFNQGERRPLGAAIGMCARPMSAHYIDDEIDRKQRKEPNAWAISRDLNRVEKTLAE